MKSANELIRALALRVLKHRGLATAVETEQLARFVAIKTGGIK